jgi:tetratricopeptide (TPR) repeat protein
MEKPQSVAGREKAFMGIRARRFWVVILVLWVGFFAGCASHVGQLREAQNEFNKASTLENEIRLDPNMGNAVNLSGLAASYRLTVQMISELIAREKGNLKKDKLIGVAYSLKALAEWRLGDYGAAVNTINSAEKYPEDMLFPRDRALLAALRGFIKNSQAYNHMAGGDYPYEDIKGLLWESLGDIQKGMAIQDAEDNLRVYFITSKLAVLKNWVDLNGDRTINKPASFDEVKAKEEWCHQMKPVWDMFVKEMERAGSTADSALQAWWGKRLGMPGACPR